MLRRALVARRRTFAVVALALTCLACGGSGPKPAAPACPETTTVDTKDAINFAPKCATVAVGATVTWRNVDGIPHTVTFTDGPAYDKYFEKDQSVQRTFDTAGTFGYYCKVHGKVMSGKIVVSTTASPTAS